MNITQQLEIIRQGTVEIIPEDELIQKLERAQKQGKPLCVKFGVDPTGSDIHLGHTVPLRKLRQLQDLGHRIIFLVGDFTACIGDPSGRSEERKMLTRQEVKENLQGYKRQIARILNIERTEFRFNSHWLEKLTLDDIVQLTSRYTVARMLERDDFQNRFRANKEISVLEFLYPLLQGYDSVVLESDLELGGTDQKFNLLVGRDLQRAYGKEPQVIATMPLLEGTDGVNKMSKSLNNHIGIEEPPGEIFGKVMSIPDELMAKYFALVTDLSVPELNSLQAKLANGTIHPRNLKRELARRIVTLYYDQQAGKKAEEEFDTIFVHKGRPKNIPVFNLSETDLEEGKIWIVRLLTLTGLARSSSEARRLIKQGGVKVDEEQATDDSASISVMDEMIVKVGKRKFVKISKKG